MNIVRRSRYLDRLIAFQDTDLIKIVTGIRRCGKSTLLDMMREHLAQQGVPAERLLTFKMESLEYAVITDYLTFYRMVRERINGVDRPYLFFDEPVLGLDAQHRELFYRLVLEKYAEHPCAVVQCLFAIERACNAYLGPVYRGQDAAAHVWRVS